MRAQAWRRAAAVVTLVATTMSALGARPQDAATQAKRAYERAVELEGRGDYSASLALLWEASGLAPNDPDIQNRLGEALDRIGALDAAIDAFRRAVATRRDFKKAENNLILTLVKAGKGPESLTRARALVAAAPNDPDRLFTLGLAQADQDLEGAIATLRQVLTLAPRHALARYNLALVLKRADRLREAIDELQRTIAVEPRAEAHYTLGTIYRQRGALDRAIASLREAIAVNSRYVDAYAALGTALHDQGDSGGAIAALKRAIALAPDQPAPRHALAQVYQQIGDSSAARNELDEAERQRVRAARAHEALVWTAVGIEKVTTGDPASALTYFNRAIATDDEYAPAHYQAGLVLHARGDHDAARAAFEKARRLNPSLISPYETPHKDR